MMTRWITPISTAIATGVGIIVLVGYFVPAAWILDLRALFLRWAVILAGLTLLVGIFNLLAVHGRKVHSLNKESWYSLALIIALVGTAGAIAWQQTHSAAALWILNWILIPAESSLMAVLAVILIYAAARLLYRRKTVFSVIFLVTVVIVLSGSVPFWGTFIPFVHDRLLGWIISVPAMAGARGLLLGMALGIIATGIRLLTGNQHPYDG
jgi:uncharacterized membrane protein YhaH (DUF805 family)